MAAKAAFPDELLRLQTKNLIQTLQGTLDSTSGSNRKRLAVELGSLSPRGVHFKHQNTGRAVSSAAQIHERKIKSK